LVVRQPTAVQMSKEGGQKCVGKECSLQGKEWNINWTHDEPNAVPCLITVDTVEQASQCDSVTRCQIFQNMVPRLACI
jgi:hypothetical protein